MLEKRKYIPTRMKKKNNIASTESSFAEPSNKKARKEIVISTSSVSLKLLIHTKSRKVIFAEAGNDFVDFLFNLMTLPLGTVTRLLSKDSMVGSLGNLYHSIESISEAYLVEKDQTKEALLKPKLSSSSLSQVPLLPNYNDGFVSRKFYSCPKGSSFLHHFHVSDDPNVLCPSCHRKMSRELTYVADHLKSQVATSSNSNNINDEGGFVKGVVTYMVMDDLVVKPMSTISSIIMLNSLNVKDMSALKEKVVHVDMAQGLNLLKASLQSKMVLTSVFLRGSKA